MIQQNKEFQEIEKVYKGVNQDIIDTNEAAIKRRALMRILKCPYDAKYYARMERPEIRKKIIDGFGYSVNPSPYDRVAELHYKY